MFGNIDIVAATRHPYAQRSFQTEPSWRSLNVRGNMETGTILIASGGWLLALIQFLMTHLEGKKRSDEALLERTLSCFERGTQARSIAISLVEGVWVKRNKYLDVITPVLVSQVIFLLNDAEDYGQESRNLIRLLYLLDKCLPHAVDPMNERCELSDALISAAVRPGKLVFPKQMLRHWFSKFNNGSTDMFDAETET
jgi:hypothetical protein